MLGTNMKTQKHLDPAENESQVQKPGFILANIYFYCTKSTLKGCILYRYNPSQKIELPLANMEVCPTCPAYQPLSHVRKREMLQPDLSGHPTVASLCCFPELGHLSHGVHEVTLFPVAVLYLLFSGGPLTTPCHQSRQTEQGCCHSASLLALLR